MVVDIRYVNKGPNQYQNVRMITFYPTQDKTLGEVEPEIVMHFDEVERGQINIPAYTLRSVTVTRD